MTTIQAIAFILAAVLIAACSPETHTALPMVGGKLSERLVLEGRIRLGEDAGDSIAGVAAFAETRTGDLLIGDRYLPRLRRYTHEGGLVAAVGRYGSGPFEFKNGITDVGELRDGRVFVAEPAQARLTILASDLAPDTVLPLNLMLAGAAEPLTDGVLLGTHRRTGGALFHLLGPGGEPRWSVYERPPHVNAEPYWPSIAQEYVAVSPAHIFVATSLIYPVLVYDLEGRLVDELDEPPQSYEPIHSVEPGAFAAGVYDDRVAEWLSSFTVISDLFVVQDSFLVVAHARKAARPPRMMRNVVYAIDVYQLANRRKIMEDISIPDGMHLLGGGRYLYVEEFDTAGVVLSRWSITH